jgi:hypothetical protein
MNWPRDNAGISERDFKGVFSYEPKDTTVAQLSGKYRVRDWISMAESQ